MSRYKIYQDRFNPEQVALNDAARKVLEDAKKARTDVDPWCLGRLRGIEKWFSFALDLDRTAPTQIGIMTQFGDQALRLDILYDKMIRNNQETMDIAKKNLDVNFKLMVRNSIVALGKLCAVVLAILPATSKVNEVVKTLKNPILETPNKVKKRLEMFKTASSATKAFIEASGKSTGGDATGKALEGALKLLGDQGAALADLFGGIVDVGG